MALEGTIKDFNLPDIFQLISLQQKTGVLVLKGRDEVVTVYFHQGMIVSADSSTTQIEDRLGHILVKSRKLTEEKLEECLKEQKNTLNRLGNILIKRGMVTPETLKEVLVSVISEKIYPVFRWEEGEYHFSQDKAIDYDKDCFSPIKTDNFLMEAAQIMDEWPLIKKKIKGPDTVYRQKINEKDLSGMISDVKKQKNLPTGTDGTIATSEIELTREEKRVYRLIDGSRSMAAITEELYDMNEFDVFRIIYDLLERNLIETTGVEQETPEPEDKSEKQIHPLIKYALYFLLLAGIFYQGFYSPHGLTGFMRITGDPAHASWIKRGSSYNRLEALSHKVKVYYLHHRSLPENLDEMISAGLIRHKHRLDPWGRIYAYIIHGDSYSLIGYDQDGNVDSDLVIIVNQPVF